MTSSEGIVVLKCGVKLPKSSVSWFSPTGILQRLFQISHSGLRDLLLIDLAVFTIRYCRPSCSQPFSYDNKSPRKWDKVHYQKNSSKCTMPFLLSKTTDQKWEQWIKLQLPSNTCCSICNVPPTYCQQSWQVLLRVRTNSFINISTTFKSQISKCMKHIFRILRLHRNRKIMFNAINYFHVYILWFLWWNMFHIISKWTNIACMMVNPTWSPSEGTLN